jgi:hypothetical protein
MVADVARTAAFYTGVNVMVWIGIGRAIAAIAAMTHHGAVIKQTPQGTPAATPPITTPPYEVTGKQTEPSSQSPSGGNAFNPQIGLVTDARSVMKAATKEEEKATVHEAEISMSADVDPFLSAEAFLSVSNDGGESTVEAEEAFGTYNNLGHGMAGRFGKFRAAVGRANRTHTHALAYMDLPTVLQDTFGEEGLKGVGGELSYLFPTERFLDVTLESIVPEDGPVFKGARPSNPVMLAHLRTFFDFNPDLSAQLGFTAANGPTDVNRANVLGLDYTMKWQPSKINHFWQLESEAYWADAVAPGQKRTNGWFAAFTTQLTPQLFATARLDYSQVPGSAEVQKGWTANLTLKPTEFHHWRVEYTHLDNKLSRDTNTLTLQFVWLIGSHPAHKY